MLFESKVSSLKVKHNHLCPIDCTDFSWQRKQFCILKSLHWNKSIIITRLDKGVGAVVLDYHVPVNKLMGILDEENFVQLRPDTTHDKTKAKLKFQKHLLKLLKNEDISVNIYDVIRLVGSVWPLLYGLPKTHRVNVLLSPNMSIVGLAQQKLANGSYSRPIMLSYIVDNTFCVFNSGECFIGYLMIYKICSQT